MYHLKNWLHSILTVYYFAVLAFTTTASSIPSDVHLEYEQRPLRLSYNDSRRRGLFNGTYPTIQFDSIPVATVVGTLFILVPINAAMKSIADNLVCSLQLLGLAKQVHFWALDFDIIPLLYDWIGEGVKVFRWSKYSVGRATRHSTSAFKQTTKKRYEIILLLLLKHYDILVCDADTVWFSDPRPYFNKSGDVLTQAEILFLNKDEWFTRTCNRTANTGIMYMRSNNRTIETIKLWVKMFRHLKKLNDQQVLSMWRGRNPLLSCDLECGKRCAPNSLQFAILSPMLFPNAYIMLGKYSGFRSKLLTFNRTQPVIAHFNSYSFGHKIAAQRKAGMLLLKTCYANQTLPSYRGL
jgi:hypothetical protein